MLSIKNLLNTSSFCLRSGWEKNLKTAASAPRSCILSFKGLFDFVLCLTLYWPLNWFWNKIVYSFDFLFSVLCSLMGFSPTADYCVPFSSVLNILSTLTFYCVFSFSLVIISSSVSIHSSACADFFLPKVIFAVIAHLLVSLFLHFNSCSILLILFSRLGASKVPLKQIITKKPVQKMKVIK